MPSIPCYTCNGHKIINDLTGKPPEGESDLQNLLIDWGKWNGVGRGEAAPSLDYKPLYALSKQDLVRMICGSHPPYDMFDELKKFGSYSGSYDRWDWSGDGLLELSENELWELYQKVIKPKNGG